jgi:hypothetical protein
VLLPRVLHPLNLLRAMETGVASDGARLGVAAADPAHQLQS